MRSEMRYIKITPRLKTLAKLGCVCVIVTIVSKLLDLCHDKGHRPYGEFCSTLFAIDRNVNGTLPVYISRAYEVKSETDMKCIVTKTHPSFPICLHNLSHDRFISGALLARGLWEPINTRTIISAIGKYPKSAVVDVGANIGYYTLLSAHLGHIAVAVEPSTSNAARLIKGAVLGRVGHKITLLNVALSNKRAIMRLSTNEDNQGGLRVANSCAGDDFPAEHICSLTMDDLLGYLPSHISTVVLKIDIEGHECQAMKVSRRFLKSVYVPYIFMEWSEIYSKRHQPRTQCTNKELLQLVRYLVSEGYVAHDIAYGKKLNPETCTRHWKIGDVYWRHFKAYRLHDT